ncbi:serine hydrolase domain-containing protein [Aquimarina celericrescens]|uniref:Beta-lactamase n=1 Tax=Aquimarina celericrescens TaxID=1964542 RepID=A0ABW5B256_9FLAO|nr:beta-lactamase family protein [Aquimarina celericrescens]
MRIYLTFTLLTCVILSSIAQEQLLEKLSESFFKDSTNYGLAVGIVHNDSVKDFYYGGKYYPNNLDIDDRTIFEIGSVSKTFTSYILASMQVKGIIHKDDHLTDYMFSSLENKKVFEPVLLKNLATHTSGIPLTGTDDWQVLQKDQRFNPESQFDLLTKEFIYEKLAKMDSLNNFGTYRYSNVGLSILSFVLQKKTSLSYQELLQKLISDPLQLKDLYLEVPQDKVHRIAMPHQKELQVPLIELSDTKAAGGVKTTMPDMLVYLNSLANPKTKAQKQIQQLLFEPQFTDNNLKHLGLSWGIYKLAGEQVYFHNGGTYGSGSIAIICPSKKLAIALFANSQVTSEVQSYGIKIIEEIISGNN